MRDPANAEGATSKHRRFSGAEHRKLEEILDEVGRRHIPWRKVVVRLKEAGFPERTTRSVRNHHLRMRQLLRIQPDSRNNCRVCGLPMRGHVCGGRRDLDPEPEAEEGEA